jgi:hypothetical protein
LADHDGRLVRVWSGLPDVADDAEVLLREVASRCVNAADRRAALVALDQPRPLLWSGWDMWPGVPAPISDYLSSPEFSRDVAETAVASLGE